MNTSTKPRRFLGTHPGVCEMHSNAWPAPTLVGPGTKGWDAEQTRRLAELSDTFGIDMAAAFLWLGYLNGETHALPAEARR